MKFLTMRSDKERDVQLAQLAFDTVLKVRKKGRVKHRDDDGDEQGVNFHLQQAYLHCMNAKSVEIGKTRLHIEHAIVRATMALLKYEEEI